MSRDKLEVGVLSPCSRSWGCLKCRGLWLTSARCGQRSSARVWWLPAGSRWETSSSTLCSAERGGSGSAGRARLLSLPGCWAEVPQPLLASAPRRCFPASAQILIFFFSNLFKRDREAWHNSTTRPPAALLEFPPPCFKDPLCWCGLVGCKTGEGVGNATFLAGQCPFALPRNPRPTPLPLCSPRRSASSTSVAPAGTGSTPWRSCVTTAR